jgi:hypothetical protein
VTPAASIAAQIPILNARFEPPIVPPVRMLLCSVQPMDVGVRLIL